MKKSLFVLAIVQIMCALLCSTSSAQTENLDKIAAIVGDKIILKSEIEMAYSDFKKENPNLSENEKCKLIEDYMSQKMLVEQAGRDSIIVSDDEIEGALDNRIRYFVSQYGSEERLVEMAGKTLYQLKDDYRSLFRDQLTAQRMQSQIMSNVKITPQEVKAFYDKVPIDSLPFYPSMVEVGQIVFKPAINKEVEDYAKQKLEGLRADIVGGKSAFDVMAGIYSEDPGSKDNGGDLGIMGRDELVPEFAAAAFRLQNGDISPVVKTKFGFHIVQMVNRQGEKAKLRHILIKPLITNDMVKEAEAKADSVRSIVMAGKMQFSEAVGKFTNDDATKITGGMFTNPQTNGSLVQTEDLDPAVALQINEMKMGTYSQPITYNDANGGDRLVRIIYLKNRTEPHKANLKDDYNKIQQVAFAEKQNEYLQKWIKEKISTFYVMVADEYKTCESVAKWITPKTQAKN
jgi:peptidyl-prolyl cis-trans isomerase SurA